MEEKRPIFLKRIILAFIIATIIFSAGFLFSYSLVYSKYQSVSISQEKIKYDLLSLQLEEKLIISSCSFFDPYKISQELDNSGNMINIIEKRLGKNNAEVIEQKKFYSLIEIQHFILVQEHNIKCNNTIPTILFFYSNTHEYIDNADRIGYILSSLKNENNNIMIYSFDYNVDLRLIDILKKKYNVTKPNSLVINGEMVIDGVNNLDELKKYF